MSENKQVDYGELDCLLGDYLATDGVILKTAISLDDMVDDILRLVEKASYKNNQLLISNSNKKPSSSLLEQLKDCIKRQPMSGLLDFQTDEGHLLDVCYRELVSLYGELDDSIIQIKSKDARIDELKTQIADLHSGKRGACFTCEPVGELNKKLEARVAELEAEQERYKKLGMTGYREYRIKEAEAHTLRLAACVVDLADEYQSFDVGVNKHAETIKEAKEIMEGK